MNFNDKRSNTFSIVNDYFIWRLRSKATTNNPLFNIVRRVAQSAEEKFPLRQSIFRCESLSLTNLRNIHNEIGKELFQDGKVTWTRIITYISFSTLLTESVIHNHNQDCVVTSMVNWTTEFIERNLRSWLEKENDWDGCLKIFGKDPQNENQLGVYGKLLCFGAMLFYGAMYIARS